MTVSKNSISESSISDAELIARVLGGNAAAYDVLVDRYSERARRYAYRRLRDLDDAEDMVQEAFIRAYRSLPSYQDQSGFGAWLFQIVHNQCYTLLQDRDARARREQRWVGNTLLVHGRVDQSMTTEPITGEDAFTEACGNDRHQAIERALLTLSPDNHEAFVLKYVDELPYDEMAARTGVSMSALKMRVARACTKLRRQLAPYEGEYHD